MIYILKLVSVKTLACVRLEFDHVAAHPSIFNDLTMSHMGFVVSSN
jgi:hypothetical protein